VGKVRTWGIGCGGGTALVAGACTTAWFATRPPTLVDARPRSADGLLVVDVAVVDVVTGRVLDHQDVRIEGETIVSVDAHTPGGSAEEVVDGSGAYLVPGLIDAHCHVLSGSAAPGRPNLPDPDLNFARLLYSGVTTVFDPGSDPDAIFSFRSELAAESRLGPSIFAAGPIFTAPGGHPVPMLRQFVPGPLQDLFIGRLTRQLAAPEDAAPAVDALVPLEPDFIKVAIDHLPSDAPRIAPDVAAALVDAAGAHGLRTVAHIGTLDDARTAVDVGASAWIHGVYKERIPDAAIGELADAHIPMVPTMVVFKSYAELGRGGYTPTPLEQAVAPPELFESWSDPTLADAVPDSIADYLAMLRDQRATALDNVGRLHTAGVTLLAGSDSQAGMLPGPSLHRELALLHEAGLPPIEVLRSATVHSARFLSGQDDPPFGVVAAGKRADLLLLDADPLTHIDALGQIRTVILRGRVLDRTPWP